MERSIPVPRILSSIMNENQQISAAIGITAVYLLSAPLLPAGGILTAASMLLLSVNAFYSVRYLYSHASITRPIVFLNCLQILLFALLHFQIYRFLGPGNYQADMPPAWHHWLELVGAYAFKAADIVDILEEYDVWAPHLTNTGLFPGILLLMMNILVDLFLFSAVTGAAGCYFPEYGVIRHAGLRRFLKRCCPPVLAGLFIFFSGLLLSRFMADPYRVDPSNLIKWPLENLLRTIDFGDAFQIFDWHLHSLNESLFLSFLSVCFRLVLSFYLLDALSSLHLRLTKGKACTVEELGGYYASPETARTSRKIAAEAIGSLGPEASEAAPRLLCCFSEPFPPVRQAGIDALIQIGPPAIPALAGMLIHNQEEVRRSAHKTIKKIDPLWAKTPEARQAVLTLLNGLLSPAAQSREAARSYLSEIREDWPESEAAADFLPHFMAALSHPDAAVRLSAVEALEYMGRHAERARFRIIKALADPNGHVRAKAIAVLEKMDAKWSCSEAALNALPFFVKQIEEKEDDAEAVINALIQIGPPAVPFLVECLENENEQSRHPCVSRYVQEALSRIDPDGAFRRAV